MLGFGGFGGAFSLAFLSLLVPPLAALAVNKPGAGGRCRGGPTLIWRPLTHLPGTGGGEIRGDVDLCDGGRGATGCCIASMGAGGNCEGAGGTAETLFDLCPEFGCGDLDRAAPMRSGLLRGRAATPRSGLREGLDGDGRLCRKGELTGGLRVRCGDSCDWFGIGGCCRSAVLFASCEISASDGTTLGAELGSGTATLGVRVVGDLDTLGIAPGRCRGL